MIFTGLIGRLQIRTFEFYIFYPKDQDASAISLNLDHVKDVSFNELHQQISELAPHIKWLFP